MGNAVPVSKKAFDKIQWNHFLYIQVIYIEKRTRTKGSWGEIIKEIFIPGKILNIVAKK